MAKVYYGKEAVKKVEEKEGRKLSYAERRVVEEEGYVPEVYKDTKGITTYGVGQTGKYMGMSFDETFQEHLNQARKLVPSFDTLPEAVQAELVQSAYRGDLGGSPNALKKLNAGDYEGFAKEFLNNEEYKDEKTSSGIKKRMEKVASTVASLAKKPPPISNTPYPEVSSRYANQTQSKAPGLDVAPQEDLENPFFSVKRWFDSL